MSKLDDLVRKHNDAGNEVFRYAQELEKSHNDLLAETLRLGKLHDDAVAKLDTMISGDERKQLRLENQFAIIQRLEKDAAEQRKALDDARGTIERLNEELANYKSAVRYQSVPASIYNYTPGQRIVDTQGREYIKLQSTASGNSAVDLETGKIVNLSLIIVKKDNYHE